MPGFRRHIAGRTAASLAASAASLTFVRVSERFDLRDFLTRERMSVWPKYLGLRQERVGKFGKFELGDGKLQRSGGPVRHLCVAGGFPTPRYDANAGNTSTRWGLVQ